MRTFAVVAVRLIGLWILASSIGPLVLFGLELGARESAVERLGDAWLIVLVAVIAPPIAGVLLLFFSRPLAAFLTAGLPDGAAAPDGPTVRGFTQIGVFLLGLFTLLRALPVLLAALAGQGAAWLEHWLTAGVGLLLMATCIQFGRLIEYLRR